MVRALLEGRKTQTRRAINPQPRRVGWHIDKSLREQTGNALPVEVPTGWEWKTLYAADPPHNAEDGFASALAWHCPYGYPHAAHSPRLWVRETYQILRADRSGEIDVPSRIPTARGTWGVAYAATDSQAKDHRDDRGFSWRPGIHMPRWASRITLEITDVRAQRLHDITEDDARAEGVEPTVTFTKVYPSKHAADVEHRSYLRGFAELWGQINSAESWAANPWVWAITFKRIGEDRR